MIVNIQITFDVKDYDPLISIMFNGQTLYDGIARPRYNFQCEPIHGLKNASNLLQLTRHGKNYKKHQDKEKDQAVVIEEIKLNGLTFPDMPSYGTFITDTQQHFHTNYLGHNGIYTFRFGSPVETWMVNRMYLNMLNTHTCPVDNT